MCKGQLYCPAGIMYVYLVVCAYWGCTDNQIGYRKYPILANLLNDWYWISIGLLADPITMPLGNHKALKFWMV